MSNLNTTSQIVQDRDGNEIREGDAVQSPTTHRVYSVVKITAGRMSLYKHGWPRIKANPTNWRLYPRREVVR